MEKSIFEQMVGNYHREGDYLLPNLIVPEQIPVGIWSQRRKRYLQEHRSAFYTALLLNGELDTHLADVDHQAEKMFFSMIEQLARQECITDQIKAENQMEWAGQMNGIRNQVEEIIYSTIIYI